MDPVYLLWLFTIGALVGGGIIGAILYRNLTSTIKQAGNLKTELDQTRAEMENYKTSINSHFDKTAELVNELTQDYVKVYQHLAEGAQKLGDTRDFNNILEQHQGKVLISVDEKADTSAQDAIVSEVIVDEQQPEETPLEISAPLDYSVSQETTPGNKKNVEESANGTASPASRGDEQDVVTESEKSASNQEDSAAPAAKKNDGNAVVEETPAAKPEVKKQAESSASA